jgi:general secretion pathway protein L
MNPGITQLYQSSSMRPVRRAANWWLEELRSLLPGSTDQATNASGSTIIFKIAGDTVSTRILSGESELSLMPVDIDSLAAGALSGELLPGITDSTRIVIQLTEDDAILTTLQFPIATEENLRRVIGFEMDRHTPFDADSVYFDFEVVAKTGGTLTVNLLVVPRIIVDGLLGALHDIGLNVDQILADASNSQSNDKLNLLPPELRRQSGKKRQKSGGKLWRVAAVLAAVVYLIPATSLILHNGRLEKRVEVLRLESAELVAGRQKLVKILEPSAFFTSLRNAKPRAIELLDDLSRIVPDDTWISSLQSQDGVVRFEGESANAAALIGILEQSEVIADSKFASPVTRNPSTSKDRYTIEAGLKGGAINE